MADEKSQQYQPAAGVLLVLQQESSLAIPVTSYKMLFKSGLVLYQLSPTAVLWDVMPSALQ